MKDKKDQEETVTTLIQKEKDVYPRRVTQAPDPITPLRGFSVTLSRPQKTDPQTDPQEELFLPLTGTELMKKWSVGWEAIFDFARQDKLIPYEPERFKTCIKDDSGMLSFIYTQQERDQYFSQWLYRPKDVEAFEAQYGEILDGWRKNVVSIEDKEPPVPVKTSAVNFFTRENDYWHIGFEGKDAKGVKNINGLLYICYLLEKPGESTSCRNLYPAVSGKTPGKIMSEGAAIDEDLNIGSRNQAASDYKARQNYLKQYQKLANDLDNVEDNPEGEIIRKEIEKEMDTITPYLKERAFPDKDKKRFQINIQRRLDKAYAAIRKAGMKEMAKHLQDNIKTDGAYGLSYSGALTWEITIK